MWAGTKDQIPHMRRSFLCGVVLRRGSCCFLAKATSFNPLFCHLHLIRPFKTRSLSSNGSSTPRTPSTKNEEEAKAFLFSPTLTNEEFAKKWDLIDQLEKKQGRPPWLGKALTYISATWRDFAKQQKQKDDSMTAIWMPPVRPETAYFVLDVLLQGVSLQDATDIVETFARDHPNVNVYAQRLQVWSDSGAPHAKHKIEAIINEIDTQQIRYTRRMYAVLLRHFRDEPDRIETLRLQINASGIIPDSSMWAALATSYATNHRVNDAMDIWKDHVLGSTVSDAKRNYANEKHLSIVQESAADIVDGLLKRVVRDTQATRAILQQAQSLLRSLQLYRIPMDDHLIYSMMRLYAHAGRFQKTRWLYHRLKYPEMAFPLLLKALNRGPVKAKGPIATRLLKKYLEQSHRPLEPQVATLVYMAWAKTDHSTEGEKAESKRNQKAGKEAMEIHNQLMKGRKDLSVVYYNTLLRCLAKSVFEGAKPTIEQLLTEMREHDMVPDETTYTMAIRSLLQNELPVEAEDLLQEMVQSPTPPSLRTVNTILAHHSNYGSLASAMHCESTLNNLNQLADDQGQEHMRANIVTYNIILNAWSKTNAPFSSNRLWKIYHRLLYRGLEPNMVTYNTLISFFTRTILIDDLVRAEKILETLEVHPTLKPTQNHYYRIMKTWIDCEEFHKAEMILDRRIAAYISGRNDKVAPVASNFHQLAGEYMMEGEIVEATEFLKRMIRICEKHKLPNHPEIKTYRILYEYWLGIEHPMREQYEKELEELMLRRFPHIFRTKWKESAGNGCA